MRFVHAADIHLDSPLRNLALSEDHQITRVRRATRDAFQALVELCLRREVQLLLLAGDLWDGDAPNMQTALYFRSQIARLDRAGIRVVIVKGNHDAANKITATLDLPPNAHIFDHRQPKTIPFDDLGAAVHGQSFRPGPVLDNLAAGYPMPVAGKLNIGILHTSLAGSADHDPYAPCSLSDLVTKGYAYWALGHIHKGAVLNEDPWVVYPGNLQGRDIREAGPKGCVVVDCEEDRVISVEHVALDVVRWHHSVIDVALVSTPPELVTAVRSALIQANREADGRPCATRITLRGTTAIASELARRPDNLRQLVAEVAAELSDDLWLEEIRNTTTPPAVAHAPTPSAPEIEDILGAAAGEAEAIAPAVNAELAALRSKLPDKLKNHLGLRTETVAEVRAAIERLTPQLAARLAGEVR